ncbi:metallophosphoesterase family protein [Lyngbya confervoides]|uniref:Metallophosphoesterase n=1 Tax=Lyngbya confervoides BDU141951 TaxID=1574623 RepID=A0ABD4T4Q1_9CYAN|nr:metallophosphoesterase [Lyngbya confervoides]MCM1983687.1 metallophosphoesterase [Lyngbya confervoides BDU141951]
MGLDLRFAILSDLHIGLPHTLHDHPTRFHLVEWSIPALETVLDRLAGCPLDFLLLPGDLTQHGELENHQWLAHRLGQLPYPVFVIPGNHDIPVPEADGTAIAPATFAQIYRDFGYHHASEQPNSPALYYSQSPVPGLRLIGLNSNQFNRAGRQVGALDLQQLRWLEALLPSCRDEFVLVMVHHNVLEHFPAQRVHPIGRRYMLKNSDPLLRLLRRHGVQVVLTGHLHVQDITSQNGIFDITTGSLVSFPHPYRLAHFYHNHRGDMIGNIESFRVESLAECPDLQTYSRQWMGDRSEYFMMRMLTESPLNFSEQEAKRYAPQLRDFWATIADGDPTFDTPEFPPVLQRYLQTYEAHQRQPGEPLTQDNDTVLQLQG